MRQGVTVTTEVHQKTLQVLSSTNRSLDGIPTVLNESSYKIGDILRSDRDSLRKGFKELTFDMKELIEMHLVGIFAAKGGIQVVNARNPILDTQEVFESERHRVGKERLWAEKRNRNRFRIRTKSHWRTRTVYRCWYKTDPVSELFVEKLHGVVE